MNVLLALTNFSSLTGSEIYTYELARVLKKRGHNVTIMAANCGGLIGEKAKEAGINLAEFFTVEPTDWDIIHAAQPGPTAYVLSRYNAPVVCTIHSSLMWERPIIDPKIKKYICIRPQIQEKIIKENEVEAEKTVVIYNGVDRTRFNTIGNTTEDLNPATLFIGTLDQLRVQAIEELILRTEKEGRELWLLSEDIKEAKMEKHIRFFVGVWNTEELTKHCTDTASVYLGRTTIEGWMCGKPGWIYDVDTKGEIKDIALSEVPDKETLKQFDIEYMTDRILEVYSEALM